MRRELAVFDVEFVVWCAKCGDWHRAQAKRGVRREGFREHVRREGWRWSLGQDGRAGWWCPACVAAAGGAWCAAHRDA